MMLELNPSDDIKWQEKRFSPIEPLIRSYKKGDRFPWGSKSYEVTRDAPLLATEIYLWVPQIDFSNKTLPKRP